MMIPKNLACALLAGGAIAFANPAAHADTIIFEADFETNQSALFDFLIIDGAANEAITDYVIDWEYDYTQYDHTNIIWDPIPHSPNSTGADTKALRLNINLETGLNMGLNLLPQLGPEFTADRYRLQFDLWCHWDVFGGGGGSQHPMWASFGSNGGTQAIYGQSGGAAFTPKGNGTVLGIAPRATTSNYVYYDGNGTIFNYNPNQPGWGGVNNNVEPWLSLFPVREEYDGFVAAGEPAVIWITVELEVIGNRMYLYMTPDGGTRTLVSNPNGFTPVNSGANLTNPYIGISDFFNTAQLENDFFLFDNVRVINLPVPSAEPTHSLLDDNPSSLTAVSFGVSFDKSVPDFNATNVATTGDLSGTVAVGGANPDYVVVVKLADPTLAGEIGIELLQNFEDVDGIDYDGTNSTSALYTIVPGDGGPGGFDPDYNGDGVVNVADVTAFAQDIADGVYDEE